VASEQYDVIIVGGGPAGLSAALWLGRYRRNALVLDIGAPRNEPAWAVHGYPGLPDPSPLELRRRLLHQARGAGAEAREGDVVSAEGVKDDFTVRLSDGQEVRARRVVLAYGLRDYIPEIDGIDELYGTSVFHCPDCDGPAMADTRIGVLGWNKYGANQALYLLNWTDRVVLLTNGAPADFSDDQRSRLEKNGIEIVPHNITRVVGHGGNLTQAEFENAPPVRLDALFFHLGSEPRCRIAEQLGCALDDDGYVEVDRGQETSCAGVHAAGDITGHPHLASIASAEGVRAALAIHRSLLPDSRHL
jgi:thioredoxin reductase